MEKYLTAREAAEELGLTPSRIRQMCDAGTIPAIRTGGHRGQWRIYRDRFVKQYQPPGDDTISQPSISLHPSAKSVCDDVRKFLRKGK